MKMCVFENVRSGRRPNFCVRGAPRSNKICETFARFLAKFVLAFERRNRAISMPNAALTRPRAALTSCILDSARSARSARRPSFACAVHQNQTKFAKRSRVFARNFARFRTPKSRKLKVNAALTRLRAFLTLCVLYSARSARQPSFASVVH